MKRIRPAGCLFLLPLLPLLLACDQRAPPAPVAHLDTIAGTVFTRNAPTGLWAEGEGWTLEEAFRLGGASGPPEELFGSQLTAVSVGPQGSVYVLDHQTDEIRVFDGAGEHRFTFAGAGRGPGELNDGVSMGWDSLGRLWVPNGFDGRYTAFDSLGSLVMTTQSYGRRGVNRLLYPLHFLGDGTFVDQVADGGVRLVRRDTAGRALDTLALIEDPLPDAPPLFSFMISDSTSEALGDLKVSLVWTLGPDGTIWQGRTDSLRLVQRSLEGDTLRVIETRHRPPRFTERERAYVEHARRELRDMDREGSFRLEPPVLQMIYPLDDGHVLAQVAGEMDRPGAVMDVFDPEGRYLGAMEWPFAPHPRSLPAFQGDTVWAVTLDSLDVPYVVRGVIRR